LVVSTGDYNLIVDRIGDLAIYRFGRFWFSYPTRQHVRQTKKIST
jgi:hypothetical protein